jgi:hypothetical protein
MDRAADRIFRRMFHVPVDIYEGPAMNHSYHEMIIGHGRCLSTIIMTRRPDELPWIDYTPTYHTAQFLATRMALLHRGRPVIAILLDDVGVSSRAALSDFFQAVAARLRRAPGRTRRAGRA